MTKKRNYNFKNLQGKPSSSNPSAGKSNGEGSSPSVNERLSELRKLEAKDAALKKRELAETANKRSVPPLVQGILGVPESAPPKPKAGVRTRERLRTPGPAPPKSWLAGSSATWTSALTLRGARGGLRKNANEHERDRPRELLRFARLSGLENGADCEGVQPLSHIALKAIAQSWDLFDEEDYSAFTEIPLRLRLRLISYIGFYGHLLNAAGIDTLLQGTEKLEQLDLASLIGLGSLTLKRLAKLLRKQDRDESRTPSQTVLESWDADESFEQSLQPSLSLNRGAQLTHLCLSHPGPGASWRDLLALSRNIPKITHLSLAYWPWPTLTPNLATATVSSPNRPDVTAGGSHYYGALDQDMEEPAILLRQLSSQLLCLKWLDLEGCQQWAPAMAELVATRLAREIREGETARRSPPNSWTNSSFEEPVLITNWKKVRYIRFAQGWFPDYWGLRSLLETSSPAPPAFEMLAGKGMVCYMEQRPEHSIIPQEELTHDQIDAEKKRARMWLQAEGRVEHAAMTINTARRDHACKPIEMDFGWKTKPGDAAKVVLRRD